jgi:multicomponent Na+:H+ antiporter subunit D
MTHHFPPGLLLILGGLLIPFIHGRLRTAAVMGFPVLTLMAVWSVPEISSLTIDFLDYTLQPAYRHPATLIFATVFSIMAFAGGWFALRQARTLELASAFVYAGSAIGVCFAGDLITLFVFWEIMMIGSTLVLWAAGTPEAHRASMRYLMVHLLGGVLLMAGITGQVFQTGSIAFGSFGPLGMAGIETWLILAGFLINAGAPPFSCWIADAYPEASPSGAVFLSAFTTKTAVFTLLVGFAGNEVLIYVGLYMAVYGIIYALLENDMRRILAYSIVNQVGFMVCGIGIGSELALNGAAAHAFAHIIYKALLLMSAGSVLHMTGKRKCTDLGGLFQSMPLTATCGIIGALAISAFPFTSGFVTKSMISSAAGEAHLFWPWMILTAASAGVFLHAGIKFPWFVFFQKDSGLRPPDPPMNMKIPMMLFAALCLLIGMFPAPLYRILPFAPADAAARSDLVHTMYSGQHLLAQFQLLLFAGLAFFVLLPLMKRTRTISLDVDFLYRKPGKALGKWFLASASRYLHAVEKNMAYWSPRWFNQLNHHIGPYSKVAKSQSTGSMTFYVILLLVIMMLIHYFRQG